MVEKCLFGEEMLQLKGEREEPREDQRAGTEEAVSKELGSREACPVGEWKGWKVEAKGKVPGGKVREVGRGHIVQGLVGHGKEFDFSP